MADDQDQSQKTEEPTQRKLDDARDKGQVASSREVNHFFMIVGSAAVVILLFPAMFRDLAMLLRGVFEKSDRLAMTLGSAHSLFEGLFGALGAALALPLAVLVLAALGGGLIQNGLVLSAEGIKPKVSKISPREGVKRLFSAKAVMEFLKGLAKISVVGVAACLILFPMLRDMDLMPMMSVFATLARLYDMAAYLFIGVAAIVAVVAGLDYLFQRRQFLKQMRMSRQDLKDEYRQTEGDPLVKNRLRQIRMERARKRMMAAVPTADVVITNPTHFAVALAWKQDEMSAPRVVAKGADFIARRIRDLAAEHGVPVIENPPLARALHGGVEIDQEIPVEHYKAVAQIISFVLKRRQKRRSA